MDNSASLLSDGLDRLGLSVAPEVQARLLAYTSELLRWNEKVSLTAITRPEEVVDKHLLDSLSVVPEVKDAGTLLDLGAGAGLPGIPLAAVLPALRVTLVDAVAKKVAFMKTGAVKAGVADRVRAVHRRAEGAPEVEGLPRADCVIARAFMDTGPFLQLARHYLTEGGRVVVMLGQMPAAEALEAHAAAAGLSLLSARTLALPLSGDPRGVAVFRSP